MLSCVNLGLCCFSPLSTHDIKTWGTYCVRQCFVTVNRFVHGHLYAEPKNMPGPEALISISVPCSAFGSMITRIPHMGCYLFMMCQELQDGNCRMGSPSCIEITHMQPHNLPHMMLHTCRGYEEARIFLSRWQRWTGNSEPFSSR